MERRFISLQSAPVAIEKREDGAARLVGYAAVFHRAGEPGTEYSMWEDIAEHIAPGAFDRALKENHDVRGLFNHDPSHVLGRSTAGTLRLSVDQRGLKYEIDMPDTTTGKDVAHSIQRGDISGSSFAFIAKQVEWKRDESRGLDIRTIKDVDLLDVGPVTYPAYEATTTGVRSAGINYLLDDVGNLLKARDKWQLEREAVQVRKRLLTLDEE